MHPSNLIISKIWVLISIYIYFNFYNFTKCAKCSKSLPCQTCTCTVLPLPFYSSFSLQCPSFKGVAMFLPFVFSGRVPVTRKHIRHFLCRILYVSSFCVSKTCRGYEKMTAKSLQRIQSPRYQSPCLSSGQYKLILQCSSP